MLPPTMASLLGMVLRRVSTAATAKAQTLETNMVLSDNELVDAQQNLYNVGYDLANLLAIAGVGLVNSLPCNEDK